jgi:hypothetical protein
MERMNMAKKAVSYPVKRIFLETLIGFVEAARCKTLDQFVRGEKHE